MDRMPRVLILITLAEPGGAQTYVAHLLPALAPRHEVVVAAYGDGPLRDAAREAGVRFVGLRHVRRPLHPGRDLLGLFELMVLIRRVRPDLVHANSSKAGVLGRVAARADARARPRIHGARLGVQGVRRPRGARSTAGRTGDEPADLGHHLRLRDRARGGARGADLPRRAAPS